MSRWSVAAVALVAFLAALARPAATNAEIEPGNIPAETIQTAYPTQPGHTYTGAFQPDTATYHDVDYLAFAVNAGETVQFTLQNTTQCVPPGQYEWCPVYLSLLDRTDTLIANGAGTIATYDDTEVFDWTFQTAGTYYMVMESNGDMPAGDPTYAVSYKMASGGGQGSPPPSPPLVRSLRVARRQHGDSVSARLTLGQHAAVRARLVTTRGRTIARVTRASLGAGSHHLTLALPARYRHRRRLSLTVRMTVAGAGGKASFVRPVTLSP